MVMISVTLCSAVKSLSVKYFVIVLWPFFVTIFRYQHVVECGRVLVEST